MPRVEGCNDVLNAFSLSGYIQSSGMGISPLSWQEIKAMNDSAGLFLDSWAMRQVRSMSEHYCRMFTMSSDNDIPPPHVESYEEYKHYKLAQSERLMLARRNKTT